MTGRVVNTPGSKDNVCQKFVFNSVLVQVFEVVTVVTGVESHTFEQTGGEHTWKQRRCVSVICG